MKINEFNSLMVHIAGIHGKLSTEVKINGIKYEHGKTLLISTSTADIDVISSISIATKNEEDK